MPLSPVEAIRANGDRITADLPDPELCTLRMRLRRAQNRIDGAYAVLRPPAERQRTA